MGSNTEGHCYQDWKAAQVKQVARRRELTADVPHAHRSTDTHEKIAPVSEVRWQGCDKVFVNKSSDYCKSQHLVTEIYFFGVTECV